MAQNQNQIQVPDADEAYRVLYEKIHAPVFFNKLAQDYGIVPADENQAQHLLEMGADLFANEQVNQEKQAGAVGDFIAQAHNSLNQLLGKQASAPSGGPGNDRLVKQAAYQLARDPGMRAAALTYQYHLTRQG
jgi:hypothetical protein